MKARIESVPCEQVLHLGPEGFLIRYTPPYRSRPYLLDVQRDIAGHYKKCRVEGSRPLLAKLPREERRAVDGVRPRMQAFISTLYNLREQCSPRHDLAYDQREALALLRLEDLLARFVEQVTAPEAAQEPRCDTQDFAPVRAAATALIARPCPPPADADEEERLLHERSLNIAAPGFNVSTDDLKPYCEHFPRAAMQPLLVFAHELLLQGK